MLRMLADPPNATDWLQAWTSAAAAAVTLGALLAVWRANVLTRRGLDDEREARRQEIARLDAERRDAQAAQARLITYQLDVLGEPGAGLLAISAMVHNDSDKPVYDLRVVGRRQGGGGGPLPQQPTPQAAGRLEPGSRTGLYLYGADRHRVPVDPLPWPKAEAGQRQLEPEELVEVDLLFTDSAGVRWRRRGGSGPVRITTTEAGP